MLGRASFLTTVLVLASLAGCISKGDDPSDDLDTQGENSSGGFLDANESAAAPDGRGELAAFKETNRTEASGKGAMEHLHDYWHGETRKHVDDIGVSLIPIPLLPCDKPGGGCTLGQSNPGTDTLPAGTAIADYDIDKPGLVYEGTSQLELLPNYINIEGDVPHPVGKVFFKYITAADEPGMWREGGELVAGAPFIIPVAPKEVDMPHQTKSLWLFRIYSDSTTLMFQMNLTITAVKGNAVVDWPPHPDLYADKSERIIFDGPVHMESKGTVDSNIFGSDAGWVNPERILSWGTERIEIQVTGVTVTTEGGVVTPSGYVFEYHNASKPPLMGNGAQYGGRMVDEGSDGTTWSFVIDITNDHDSYDTPYGTKSRWGFRFVPQFDNGGAACYDEGGIGSFLQQILWGCQVVPWKMDYTMTIKAYGTSHGEELPDPNAQPS